MGGNDALTSLGDFPSLQSIGGVFGVFKNTALSSLGGFPMLASIGSSNGIPVSSTGSREDNVSIKVEENGRLQDCCVLTTFLSGGTNAVSGKVIINKNASGCSNTTEVNCDPFLQVDQKVIFVAKTATESRFTVSSTQHWQLTKPNTGAEWITNIAADGGNSNASSITGENDAFITIMTTTNPNNAGRSTTLTIRGIDMAGNTLTNPAPITILFTQLGTTHTGDVSVITQAEVNALRTSLTAGVTSIMGNVTIGSESGTSDISDLSPFAAITQITGDVLVRRNPDLTNLMGLNQLQTIGGRFVVYRNRTLTSLGDFSALQTIGGYFSVSDNAALTSLGDFPTLKSIGGGFVVKSNSALTSLGDFPTLKSIGGGFVVKSNSALTSLGDFSSLQSIGGSFGVGRNHALTSLGGFPMLVSIGSDRDGVSIKVEWNKRLQDCCVLTAFLSGATNAVSGKVIINKNATGCNSTTEVNCDPFLQVDQKVVFIAKTATEGTLDLFSTLPWQLSKPNTGAEWITNIAVSGGNSDPSSVTGENYASITITTTANPSNAGRSTTLTLRTIDQTGNALTDPAPITISFTQLGITHTGDVSVTTQAEVDALRHSFTAGVTSIMGNVTIGPKSGTSDISDLSPLAAITEITGDMLVLNNPDLPNLMGLNQLQSIGGSFGAGDNASLTSLGNFPALQTIGGFFVVGDNRTLTSLGDFPALQSIGGYFGVGDNRTLTSLGDFPALQTIGGGFGVGENDDLTSLGNFPALQAIGGSFLVGENVTLTSLGGFPMLTSIGSDQDGVSIKVEENDRLQDCCVFTTFFSGAKNAVSGKVIINDNAPGCNTTTQVNCDPFLQVSQKVVFVAKTATESRFMVSSTQHWQLSKSNTGAEWITNIAADGGNSDASSITGENDASITITTIANPNNTGRRTTLTLTAIDQAGNTLTEPAPVTISFTQLGTTHTGDISVTTQAEVDALRTSLTAGATSIVGNVTIGPESRASDISDLSPLAAITQITGKVLIQRNPDLPNLMGLNQLQSIGGSFEVWRNGSLTSLGDFPVLQSIGGRFEVKFNYALTSLGDFTALQSIGDVFGVVGNVALTSLGDFTALQTIGGSFEVGRDGYDTGNAALTSLGDFSALQTIGGHFLINRNATLTSLGNFPVLQSIGGVFGVRDNDTLTSLGGFPVLTSIGIGDSDEIHSDLNGVSIFVEGNELLQDCCVLTTFLRDATNAVSGKAFINDNATGCSSTTEVNCDPFLQVGQKVVFVAKTATEGTLDLFSTLRWQLSKPNTGAEWITNIVASGGNSDASSITGENHAFITITTTANPSNAGRSTTLMLRAIDMAGNALIDLESITIPFTQLGITHTGDISVTTQAEVNALRTSLTAGVTSIMGNVTIGSKSGTSDISDLSPLAAITQITGKVLIQRNPDLPNLMGLNQLQSIGGDFEVRSNIALTSLGDFSALQSIGGFFVVGDNRTLTSLGNFPTLQTIGGYFGVGKNAALTSLGDFPALQTIGGFFGIVENATLTSLGGFPMLASIGSSDEIDSDLNGVSILVEGNDRLQDCCVLTAFLRDATNAVSGKVMINKNTTGCSSTTEVNCNPFLKVDKKVIFVAKTATKGTLDLFSTLRWQLSKPNTGAEWITNIAASDNNSDASSITGENYAFITITTTANPSNAGRSTTLMLRAIDMAGNALTDLASVTIPFIQLGITHTGDVSITTQAEADALRTSLTAGATRIVGNVTIGSKSGTSDISDLSPLAAIIEVTGNVLIQRNPDLTNLMGLNQLQSIGGFFGAAHNRTLTSLGDFPDLQTIGDFFGVGENVSLTSLGDFPVLQSIGGSFLVGENTTLTSLGGFPMLTSIGSDQDGVSIKVEDNARLQDCCVLTAFLSGGTNAVSGKVIINDNNALGCNSTTQVNCDPFLQVGQKIVFVAKTATEGTLDLFSTLHWQLSKPNTGAEWITNIAADGSNSDASSITGENDASITITTTTNPSNAGRSTTLTLTAIDMTGNALTDPTPVTIPFTQLGTTHTGDVSVTTQAEVDALRTSLTAGATRIVGNVTIGPKSGASDISDLSPFAAITEITGNVLVWRNPDLPNLMGLNQLQTIWGDFGVYGNDDLTSLGDFPALQSIGYFSVSSNVALTSLGDFPALQTIGGTFWVSGNDTLTSLGGFPMLASIGSSDGVYVPSTGNREDNVSIVVERNEQLQDCCVLTAFLSGAKNAVSGKVIINKNASGCSSEAEMKPCARGGTKRK